MNADKEKKRTALAFIVLAMGLKPSPLGETFRILSRVGSSAGESDSDIVISIPRQQVYPPFGANRKVGEPVGNEVIEMAKSTCRQNLPPYKKMSAS